MPGCGEPRRYRGRSRCQGNGGGAAEGRCGAERCGAERPRGRSGPGQVCAIRTALRRSGVCGGKGGGWGARPSFLIRGLRSAVSFSICNSAWLVGWVFFLLFSLKPFCSLFPRRSRRWSPVPPPGRCSACCCSASPPAQVSPELSRSAVFFSLSPLLPSFLPLLSPLPTPHRPRCGAAALCYDLSRR